MSLHITPAMLETAYELLRTTPPFRGWHLPLADDVTFHVVATPRMFADHSMEAGVHCIRVSQRKHGHLSTLLATLAHEMIHMREAMLKTPPRVAHGKTFHRLAAQVCKFHGFDPGSF